MCFHCSILIGCWEEMGQACLGCYHANLRENKTLFLEPYSLRMRTVRGSAMGDGPCCSRSQHWEGVGAMKCSGERLSWEEGWWSNDLKEEET